MSEKRIIKYAASNNWNVSRVLKQCTKLKNECVIRSMVITTPSWSWSSNEERYQWLNYLSKLYQSLVLHTSRPIQDENDTATRPLHGGKLWRVISASFGTASFTSAIYRVIPFATYSEIFVLQHNLRRGVSIDFHNPDFKFSGKRS